MLKLNLTKLLMGAGGEKKGLPEIDDTRAAVRDDQFEEVVERIKKVAEDFEDETHPLYVDIGHQEFEVGTQRIITFNLNKFDFKLTRNVEHSRLQGAGRQKHLEENKTPKISIKLHRKSQLEETWQAMDLDALF